MNVELSLMSLTVAPIVLASAMAAIRAQVAKPAKKAVN